MRILVTENTANPNVRGVYFSGEVVFLDTVSNSGKGKRKKGKRNDHFIQNRQRISWRHSNIFDSISTKQTTAST